MTITVYMIPPPETEPPPVTDTESFVHWHIVDGVLHERPVAPGRCEYCDEDNEP